MLSACWLIGAYFLAVSSHKRGRLNTSVYGIIEWLQTELKRVTEEKDRSITGMREDCVKIITSKGKEIKEKDNEIKRLKEQIGALKSAKDVQEALRTREKLQAVSQQERDAERKFASTQKELASTHRELASAKEYIQNLQHEATRSRGQYQREMEGLARKQQELERERARN